MMMMMRRRLRTKRRRVRRFRRARWVGRGGWEEEESRRVGGRTRSVAVATHCCLKPNVGK